MYDFEWFIGIQTRRVVETSVHWPCEFLILNRMASRFISKNRSTLYIALIIVTMMFQRFSTVSLFSLHNRGLLMLRNRMMAIGIHIISQLSRETISKYTNSFKLLFHTHSPSHILDRKDEAFIPYKMTKFDFECL